MKLLKRIVAVIILAALICCTQNEYVFVTNAALEKGFEFVEKEETWTYLESGGNCKFAPNFTCDLYVNTKTVKGPYEEIKLDYLAGKSLKAIAEFYVNKWILAAEVVVSIAIKEDLISMIIDWLKTIVPYDVGQDTVEIDTGMTCMAWDTVEMVRGYVNGTLVQSSIYKKEHYRQITLKNKKTGEVFTTNIDSSMFPDENEIKPDPVSVIGQYGSTEGFMTYCIGRYANEQHKHTYDNSCSDKCNVCGGGFRTAKHNYKYKCSETCSVCGNGNENAARHVEMLGTCYEGPYCLRCNKVLGEPLGHYPSETDCIKGAVCFRCNQQLLPGPGHTYKITDCTKDTLCKVCGEVAVKASYVHNWNYAKCGHPDICETCGIESGEPGDHLFSGIGIDCQHYQHCLYCGEENDIFGYHDFQSATCYEPETCKICGAQRGEKREHFWKSATCTEPMTCFRCGKTQGTELGHNYLAATCTSPMKCERCHKTVGKELGHSYEKATCTTPETCSRCGKTNGKALGHSFTEATCNSPETCTLCGLTKGNALEHKYIEATCTSPEECELCGHTEGSALGHTVEHATCTHGDYCVVCNEVLSEPLPHLYRKIDGVMKCKLCGKYRDYITPTRVKRTVTE